MNRCIICNGKKNQRTGQPCCSRICGGIYRKIKNRKRGVCVYCGKRVIKRVVANNFGVFLAMNFCNHNCWNHYCSDEAATEIEKKRRAAKRRSRGKERAMQLYNQHRKGATCAELAEQEGICVNTLYSLFKHHGITITKHTKKGRIYKHVQYRNCQRCGRKLTRKQVLMGNKTCSRECGYETKSGMARKKCKEKLAELRCLNCAGPITEKQVYWSIVKNRKFCSHSCSMEYYWKKKRESEIRRKDELGGQLWLF